MYSVGEASDAQSLQLKLRLAADPLTSAYEVTVAFCEIDLVVEVFDLDLRRAMRTAAQRCADRLCDRGYVVTTADVVNALVDALEASELGPPLDQVLN
jgi:hypothetical protein